MKKQYKLPSLPLEIPKGLRSEIKGLLQSSCEVGIKNTLISLGDNINDDTFELVLYELIPTFKGLSKAHLQMMIKSGGVNEISQRLLKIQEKEGKDLDWIICDYFLL